MRERGDGRDNKKDEILELNFETFKGKKVGENLSRFLHRQILELGSDSENNGNL